MKKFVLIFIIVSLFVTLIPMTGFAKTELTYVAIMPDPDRLEIMRSILDKFEKLNPDIDVELRGVPWDKAHQKLITTIYGGNPPDIQVVAEVWVAELAAMDGLIDVDKYLKEWDFYDRYSDVTKNKAIHIYGDKTYQIPYGYYAKELFYRKDVFKEKGLEEPKTFDEFLDVCKSLTDEEKGIYAFSMRGARGSFYPLGIFAFGNRGKANYFDENNKFTLAKEECIEGLEFYADLYRKHKVAPEGSINWGFSQIVSNFCSGNTMMYINDQPTVNAVVDRLGPEKVGTCKVPVGPSGERFVALGWMGWSLPKQKNETDEHLQARLKLLKFLATPENVLEWDNKNLLLPTIKDPFEINPDLYGDKVEWVMPSLETVQNGQVYTYAFPYPEMGKFMEQISWQDWQSILGGKATVKEIMNKWAEYHESAYEKYLNNLE